MDDRDSPDRIHGQGNLLHVVDIPVRHRAGRDRTSRGVWACASTRPRHTRVPMPRCRRPARPVICGHSGRFEHRGPPGTTDDAHFSNANVAQSGALANRDPLAVRSEQRCSTDAPMDVRNERAIAALKAHGGKQNQPRTPTRKVINTARLEQSEPQIGYPTAEQVEKWLLDLGLAISSSHRDCPCQRRPTVPTPWHELAGP